MENREVVLTFTIAECGEYHSLGEYHEGIRSLEEAVAVYLKIPPERMNGIPAIGIIKTMCRGGQIRTVFSFVIYRGRQERKFAVRQQKRCTTGKCPC